MVCSTWMFCQERLVRTLVEQCGVKLSSVGEGRVKSIVVEKGGAGMAYTIWSCCGHYDQEDTKEDAISLAVAYMQGDGHTVLAVEGPNGEDLMPEVNAADRQRSREWLERRRLAPKPIGRIEIAGPGGDWIGREFIYSEPQRVSLMRELVATYGDSRVRWTPEV